MLIIRVEVLGEGPQENVGPTIAEALLRNMSRSDWKLVVNTERGDRLTKINTRSEVR